MRASARNFERLKRGLTASNLFAKERARSRTAGRLLGALLKEKFNSFAIRAKCCFVITVFLWFVFCDLESEVAGVVLQVHSQKRSPSLCLALLERVCQRQRH